MFRHDDEDEDDDDDDDDDDEDEDEDDDDDDDEDEDEEEEEDDDDDGDDDDDNDDDAFPNCVIRGGFVQSNNQISTATISLLQADRAAVVASREDGPVSKRGNVNSRRVWQGCRFVPYTFSERSRHRWVPKDLNWFAEFGFDSAKSTKPWACLCDNKEISCPKINSSPRKLVTGPQ